MQFRITTKSKKLNYIKHSKVSKIADNSLIYFIMRLQVITAVFIKIQVFLSVTARRKVRNYRHFEGA